MVMGFNREKTMKRDLVARTVLIAIAGLLGIIAINGYSGSPALAQR